MPSPLTCWVLEAVSGGVVVVVVSSAFRVRHSTVITSRTTYTILDIACEKSDFTLDVNDDHVCNGTGGCANFTGSRISKSIEAPAGLVPLASDRMRDQYLHC